MTNNVYYIEYNGKPICQSLSKVGDNGCSFNGEDLKATILKELESREDADKFKIKTGECPAYVADKKATQEREQKLNELEALGSCQL